MTYTPTDILDYVIENEKEADFMVSLAQHKGDFTIAEIVDAKYLKKEKGYTLKSATYNVNVPIEDPEIQAAINVEQYISSFISKSGNEYQIHFFVHGFKKAQKSEHEEEILRSVVEYMILKTIIKLRLDSPQKVDSYIGA